MSWRKCTLGEVVRFQRGHDLPDQDRKPGDVPVIGSAGPNGWHNEAKAKGPGVSIGRSGASIGKVTYTPTDYWPHNACLYVTDFLGNDPRFIYYFLKTKDLTSLNSGAAQPSLNRNFVHLVPVRIPGGNEQRAIADILSAYDDLIENNRRRIALLEEAARLLYREWFVHFRFPGHEHVPLTDGFPEGWERRTLLDLAEVVMGQSPKSEFYNDTGNGLPFHQGVTDYGFRFVSHRTYSTMVTKIAEAGDILVSVRAPVGRINITPDKIVLGRGLSAIRSRTGHQSFLFYALKNHFYAEDIIGSGAIYAATNKKELEGQELVVPSSVLLTEFESQAATFDRQIANLTSQNEKLAQARDILLPRLMNGEITV